MSTSAGGPKGPPTGSPLRPTGLRLPRPAPVESPNPPPQEPRPAPERHPLHLRLPHHLPEEHHGQAASGSGSAPALSLDDLKVQAQYEGWLRKDHKGRFIMGTRAAKHAGEMLVGVPSGYLRTLLRLRGLPPAVRVILMQHTSAFEPAPDPNSPEWVPFLFGDTQGWVPRAVYEQFEREVTRLMHIWGTEKLSTALEAMVINSVTTPAESLV